MLVCGLINHGLHRLASLTLAMLGMVWAANAATGTSDEFRMDLSGMGPWEMRTARASEAISYSSAWATNAFDGANAVVKVWPVKREKPKYIAIDLSGGTTATHYPIEYLDDVPDGGWTDEYKTTKLVLRHIPAGTFIMGGRETDYPGAVNTNLHEVTLTKDFYMGVFEVTQRQWELVMGNRPSYVTNTTYYAMRPVEHISYEDIRGASKGQNWPLSMEADDGSFVVTLRNKSGLTGLDLPTEAQWEYSCRAGTTTALNTGKNLSSMSNSVEMLEAGRYWEQSGWIANGYQWSDAAFRNAETNKASTYVGTFQPNACGLYDMHGNVWELCLDVFSDEEVGVIDPVGPDKDYYSGRVVKGGSWRHPGASCRSAHREHFWNYSKLFNVGFRLCLQGGEIPETTAGVELVNAAGEGTANWTPTKAGTYYLTHETQTNGVNGAELLGAWFTVAGPELTFEYDGGPFVGGNVTINGNLDGWTVYYTTDGSTPTVQSTAYTGPFMLPAAATVQAFAVSDGGIVTDVYSQKFDVVEHARIENVRARQRWPWNGKVDIDCKVYGIYEAIYRVKFAVFAVDLDSGNTNKVSHFWVVRDGTNSNDRVVHTNGEYRIVWDARADLGEVICSNMVVSVSLVEDVHKGVQLWDGGPYWAETNIGAEEPWEYGYYFWWGDTVGYVFVGDAWVANDGSSSNFPWIYEKAPTANKNIDTLQSEGWIVSRDNTYILASEHDAAHVQWGDAWRVPTLQDLDDLIDKCDWTWTTTNGVSGYDIHGRGEYATSSIFLPANGDPGINARWGDGDVIVYGTGVLSFANMIGRYWSSVPEKWNDNRAEHLHIEADQSRTGTNRIIGRSNGAAVRPVQDYFDEPIAPIVPSVDSASFLLDTMDGTRQSAGDEMLTYSSLWDGGEDATVTIAQDGKALVEGLAGEGERAWSVTRNGTYVLTHTTYTNGVAGKVETATFVVTGKDVPFAEGDVTVSGYEAKYDGAAHGIGVTVASGIENVVLKYAVGDGTPTIPWGTEPPTLTDVGSMTVWCEISAPGYITQTNSATVTILPREVTLTSGGANKVYDGTALVKHDVAVSGDGFVDGEGASYEYIGSQTGVGTSENTFTYTLKEGTKTGNYDITTATGTLTVTKASAGGGSGGDEPGGGEVPQGDESKFDATAMYDGEGHTIDTNALVVAFDGAVIGEFAVVYAADDGSGANGGPGAPALPWLADAPAYTNAGEYIIWYRVSNPNYVDFIHTAKVTITNRPVTVTVVGHTATYGYDTTEKGVAGYDIATADALYDIAADTAFRGGVIDAALPAAVRTDVGTTAMGLTAADFANNNANFLVTYLVTDGWVKVNPRVIGDDPANWDIRLARNPMYDGTLQTAPITQVAFVKPDGNLDNIPYMLSGNTATDAGNYVVRITGTGNYSGTVEKEWAITPRNVSLASGGAEWVYDGTAHSETAVTVGGDGFADGEGASYSGFPVVRHVSDAAVPTANAFTYTLNANTKAGNYSITTANGTVKMNPRAITLTAPTKSKPYDGSALTFGAAEVTAALNGDGGVLGDRALPDGESFTFSNFASITEAGRVDATFTVADGTALTGDYAITTVPGSLTVTRSATEITVTAKSGSWTYDGQPHSLHEYEATNLGTLIASDALEVTFSDESVATTPLDGPEGNGVVANVITGVRVIRNGADDVTANYTLAPYNGTLTVTRRPVTLTSKSDTKVYDGEPLTAHEVTVGGDGFVGEDGATYDFTGSQTEKGTSKNAFSYTLTSSTNAAYYDITKVEGDLEVTAADISQSDEGDWQITFGPALTYTGLEQIQTLASVTYKGLPLDYSVTGNAQTDAGTYQMTLTGQGNFSGTHEVAWSIAPKSLTLTAGSGSRVYDGTAFTVGAVTASGFVAGEGAEYTCDGSQKDVGSSANEVSAISWNANTKASNYAVTKVAGTLTVTPRPVTLTAANLSKPYDGTPLALTAADIAANGIVAGESFTYSDFASRTEAGQTPATFSYAAGPGTSLANYAVTVTAGRMITITKSATAISVTAASESWVYDAEAHSNRTWTATNLSTLQSGDELEVTFDESSAVTTPQDGPVHDGVVPNTITSVRVIRNGADDVTANYSVEWFPGTLAVTKRPVTVTVTGHTATCTYDGEEKTVTGYDATTADALYDIAADTEFSGVATTNRTDAGKSDMGLKAADFTNNDDCFDVTYAVTDGWVKINPLDIAATDDGDFALVLGANPKYNGTVQTIPVESVTCGGLPVTYTLAGENATHAGTYTLTVKANGNFTGERSTTWQVLKRAVTLTSGSASKVYDGSPLANANVAVGGDGFIGIEGATFDVTGSQTVAGTGKNTFAYTLKAGTLAGDYDITKVEGDLVVTPATLNPADVFGGEGTGDNPLVCEKTFNGAAQPVEIVPNFDEPYQFLWALAEGNENAYSATPPTLRNVADGELTVFFKFVTANYEPYYGKVVFRILAKELTDEMVVLSDEAFYYDPGSTVKKPSVTVADTNALGEVISTANDYTVAYEDATAAGAIPVTVTAKNNYFGEITKTFPVLKRPVAPPVIGTKAYNGRTQKATVTTDSRWTVVRNNGGVNVGEYEVVLRLTNTDDYCWKGIDAEESDWTGVFMITKANNGWSRYPGIQSWTNGVQAASEPAGQPRYGTLSVAYRRQGADISTETSQKPSMPGKYIARFWVEPTENYIGVAMNSPYEVEFEIYRGPNDTQTETQTTPVPVPYVWLDPYLAKYGEGDYEAAGKAKGRNGCFLWESYVAGLNPEDPTSKFRAFIEMLPDNTPKVTWSPDISNAEKPRTYTTLGKANLTDKDWVPVTDANKPQMRFFKVKVEIKE